MTNQEAVALIKKNPVGVVCWTLSIVLAAAIYFRTGAIPEAEAALAEKSTEAERYTLNLTNSAQLKEQLDALIAAGKAIDARTVRASQLGVNTGFFHKLVKDTGVTLADFRQTTPPVVAKPAKGTYLPVAFSTAVQGDLPDLLNFLQELESGAHYCRIITASFNGNPLKRAGQLTLSLNLELLGQP